MPAVIPLTIEDPEIQEEVEKARRVKLMKLLGHGSLKPTAKNQMAVDPELPVAHDNLHGAAVGHQTSSRERRSTSQPSHGHPGLGHTRGDGQPPGDSGSGEPSVGSTSDHHTVIQPAQPPPSQEMLLQTAQRHALGQYQASDAYCSNPDDVPDRPR